MPEPIRAIFRTVNSRTSTSYNNDLGIEINVFLRAFDFFSSGRLGIKYQNPLRSVAFSSSIPNFRGLRSEGQLPDGTWPGDIPPPEPWDSTLNRGPGPLPQTYSERMGRALSPTRFSGGSIGTKILTPYPLLIKGPSFPWFPSGHILIGGLDYAVTGAITDFSFSPFAGGTVDPSFLMVDSSSNEVASGGVGAPWSRHYAVITPPANARYMAIGGKFQATPNGINQNLYGAQVEVMPVGQNVPSAYSDPREVRTILRPDRINWSQNSSFVNDLRTWSGLDARVADPGAPSGYAGQKTLAGGSRATVEHVVEGLKSNSPYFIRLRIMHTSDLKGLTVNTGGVLSPGNWITEAQEPYLYGGRLVPVTDIVITTNTGGTVGTGIISLGLGLVQADSGTILVRSILVEDTGESNRQFFDGYFPGDYFWETGQTDGNSRSYYYKNFLARYKTIKGILEDDAPMGVGIADPQYATSPLK